MFAGSTVLKKTRENEFSVDQYFPTLRASHDTGRFRILKEITNLFLFIQCWAADCHYEERERVIRS